MGKSSKTEIVAKEECLGHLKRMYAGIKMPISNDKSLIELYGIVHSESELAVYIDFGDSKEWIPKSQMEDWPNVGDDGIVLIKEWIAEEKGLI